MGFLDRFLKRKSSEKIELRLSELDSYIENNITLSSSQIKKVIEQNFEKISKELELLRTNLNNLQISEIKDKVPEKAKVRVLGNRDAYVLTLRTFINNYHLPEVIDQEIALTFCDSTQEKLTNLGKSTKNNYYITQQLLGIELEKVSQNLRNLSYIANKLKEDLEKEEVIILKNLKQRISQLKEKKSKELELSKKISELEHTISPYLESRKELNESMAKLKETKDYHIYENLAKEKDTNERKMKALQESFSAQISTISKYIKKYNKSKDIQLLKDYLESPFATLLQDINFQILSHLQAISESINKEELTKKDKQKEKIQTMISSIKLEYLSSLVIQYTQVKSQFFAVKGKMLSTRIAEDEMILKSKIDSLNNNLTLYETEVNQLKKIKEKIVLEEDSRVIVNLLNKLTNKEYSLNLN